MTNQDKIQAQKTKLRLLASLNEHKKAIQELEELIHQDNYEEARKVHEGRVEALGDLWNYIIDLKFLNWGK